MADDTLLVSVLDSLRERGALGEVSLISAVAHAELFVSAIPPGCTTLLDLGSGGGLPGLVIACRLPHLRVTLTDRRERRMDLVRRACSRLGLEHVAVLTGDVRHLARQADLAAQFDVVTARAFGEPLWTAECAAPFLRSDGSLIVSEPPNSTARSTRWPAEPLRRLGFVLPDDAHSGVQRLVRAPDQG